MELPLPFFFILLFAMAIGIGESILSSFWVPAYFRFGIPLYRQSFKLAELPINMASMIPQLEAQLPRSWWQPPVVFKELVPYELAFRHRFGSRNPTYGRVLFDPLLQELSITGYCNWSLFLFPFLFVAIAFVNPFLLLGVIFMMLGLVVHIGMQRANYGRVSQAIQNTFQIQNLPEQPYLPYSPDYNPLATSKSTGLTSIEILLLLILAFMAFVTAAIFAIVWLSWG